MEFLAEIKGLNLLCEYLIKSSLVLTFALLLFFLSRKKSASLKHFMLSFSLISLLLIPIVSSVTTGWETKLLPSWQTKWHSLTLTEGRTNPTDVFIPGNLNNSGFKVNKMHPIADVKKGSANKRSLGSILADYKNFWGIILVMTCSLGILFLKR